MRKTEQVRGWRLRAGLASGICVLLLAACGGGTTSGADDSGGSGQAGGTGSSDGGTGATGGSGASAAAPTITAQPQDVAVAVGGSASFSVVAAGSMALTYQWWRDGAVIGGATAATLVLDGLTAADSGAVISVVVSADGRSTASTTATLTVRPAASGLAQPRLSLTGLNGLAVRTDGMVLVWGSDEAVVLADASGLPGSVARMLDIPGGATAVWGTNGSHALALGRQGRLYGWGFNIHGALGGEAIPQDGEQVRSPRLLAGVDDIVTGDVGVGHAYTYAVRRDGTVWHWPGTRTTSADGLSFNVQPGQVPGLGDVVALGGGGVDADGLHMLALRRDGTVWDIVLPDPGSGAGGDVKTFVATVSQVAGFGNIVQVVSDGVVLAGRRADGSVVYWSRSPSDQADWSLQQPMVVDGLHDVRSLALKAGMALVAVRTDGSVWTWSHHMAGGGPAVLSQVAGLSGALEVVGDGIDWMVRLGDGTLWGWGANIGGQLADGTTAPRDTSVQAVGIQLD